MLPQCPYNPCITYITKLNTNHSHEIFGRYLIGYTSGKPFLNYLKPLKTISNYQQLSRAFRGLSESKNKSKLNILLNHETIGLHKDVAPSEMERVLYKLQFHTPIM
jgi:hypothetical protein